MADTATSAKDAGGDLRLGRFRLRYALRHVGEDGGPTLHIYGPYQGREEEVLRFDCFDRVPHYHLGWSYRDEPFHRIDAEAPFAWALAELGTSMNDYLERAGVERLSEAEQAQLPGALEALALRHRESG